VKLSLRLKIVGSFALIVLISLVLVVWFASHLTRLGYDEFAEKRDLARAGALAGVMGEWVTEFKQNEAMPSELPREFLLLPSDRTAMGKLYIFPEFKRMGRMERRKTQKMMPMENHGIDHMVVTDTLGNVLLDTAGLGKPVINPLHGGGVLMSHNGSDVGYLYFGQMIPELHQSPEIMFFREADKKTWIITAVVFLFAMLLGLLLSQHIVSPVKSMNLALKKVAEGQLSVRLPDERKDELGDLNRGFNGMSASLESADLQRKRLIADSAHELRTPVSLIRARIEMIEAGIYPMDGDALKALSAESERLTRLVEELKTLANLESPDAALKRQPLNFLKVVNKAVRAIEPEAARRGLTIQIQAGKKDMVLKGDGEKMHQLLSNLLSNALRHAAKRILLTVEDSEMDVKPKDEAVSPASGIDYSKRRQVKLTVEDDGLGIPMDECERVFERYYRLDTSRSREDGGSGLGLAICEGIVHSHGGRIYAAGSTRLGGACFSVVIPY